MCLHNTVASDLTGKLGQGYWSKQRSLRAQRERIRNSEQRLPGRMIWVLEEGADLLGSTTLSTSPAPFWRKTMWAEPDAPALCVSDLALFPAAEGKGLGKALMEFAEEAARSHGLCWVRLDAFTVNPHSTAFYRHIGYDERGNLAVGDVALILFEKRVLV